MPTLPINIYQKNQVLKKAIHLGDRDCGYTLSWYSSVSLMASSSARLHPASKPCRTATAPRNIPSPNSGRSGTLSVARVMRMESRCSTAPPGHGRTPPSARPSSTASSPSPRVAVTRKKGPAVRRHTRRPCARDAVMMSAMVGRGAVGRAAGAGLGGEVGAAIMREVEQGVVGRVGASALQSGG